MNATPTAARKSAIARHFDAAATGYEQYARIQAQVAERLAARIATLPLPARPRILEIGCGTGLLTRAVARHWPQAQWTVTDLSPAMLKALDPGPIAATRLQRLVLDGEWPQPLAGRRFDLICSSLAVQWFDDVNAGLERLAALLDMDGHMAIATLAQDTFHEWRASHAACGQKAATPSYPEAAAIHPGKHMRGGVETWRLRQTHADALDFLRSLRGIGAMQPAASHTPLTPGALRRVCRHFDQQGAHVSYHIAQGIWHKNSGTQRGVFVTGTDTGIGKTLASAILVQAWNADYWKPLQSGVAAEAADADTVTALTQLPPTRLHPSAHVLQAPLSPHAAARLENITIDTDRLQLPVTTAPLVVEGAGGLLVPITDDFMMIDLIARLGLPAVLVARSTLGTINHSLLSIQALRARGIPILGVILSGPVNHGNREAIEQFGQVRVLAEIPHLEHVDTQAVRTCASTIPSLDALWPAVTNDPH